MDRSDCLGRPAVAGADWHLGMAGCSAAALDLFRAHGHSPPRAFAKTEFGGCRACTLGSHNGPCCPGLRSDGVSDFLSRLDDQCRFTSWCTRNDSDYWIIAFGNYEFQSTAGSTLVSAVNASTIPKG